jgi:hypothetical protein
MFLGGWPNAVQELQAWLQSDMIQQIALPSI